MAEKPGYAQELERWSQRREEARRLREAGMTKTQIAAELGVSRHHVAQILGPACSAPRDQPKASAPTLPRPSFAPPTLADLLTKLPWAAA